MGKRRLMQIVNTDAKKFKIGISISEWKAGQILDKFHSFCPSIRKVFHTGIREALETNDRVLVTPFGRYRKFFDRWRRPFPRSLFPHSPGNCPRSSTTSRTSRIERFREDKITPRFIGGKTPFAIEAHDAFLGLVPTEYVGRYVEILNEEMNRPIDFTNCTLSRGLLVIPAEAKIGRNYKECKIKGCYTCEGMHDYKLAA